MTISVRKVNKDVQKQLDDMPTTVARIRFLTKAGWETADIARKLGKLYQHVWNEQQRPVKTKK